MLTNIIRLWRSAQSCRRDEEKPLRVLGCSDLSGQILFFLYYPPHKFSNTSKTLYLYISCRSRFWKNQNPPSRRARPVPRRRGRSTRNVWKFSAGKTGRAINGTTIIWIWVENCGKWRLSSGGLDIFYCFLSRLCLALLFLLFARKCVRSVKETHSNATIWSIRAERSRVVETERWKSDRHFNRILPQPCVLPLLQRTRKKCKRER